MNTRRNLLIILGAAAVAPHDIFAQSKKPPVVIGWLSWSSRGLGERYRDVFKKESATLGWKERIEGSRLAFQHVNA